MRPVRNGGKQSGQEVVLPDRHALQPGVGGGGASNRRVLHVYKRLATYCAAARHRGAPQPGNLIHTLCKTSKQNPCVN